MMKFIFTYISKFASYNEIKSFLIDFAHLPVGYLEALSSISDAGVYSQTSQFNAIYFLLFVVVIMKFKWLRDKVANRRKLALILEPFMVTWLFTSLWYASIFAISQVVKADPMYQSTGSFLALFAVVGVVIYSKKNARPVFFISPTN
jgi:hypothetical protein